MSENPPLPSVQAPAGACIPHPKNCIELFSGILIVLVMCIEIVLIVISFKWINYNVISWCCPSAVPTIGGMVYL